VSGRVRLEDLRAPVRAQVVAELGQKPKRSRGSSGTTTGGSWRCGRCGEPLTVYAQAERHIDTQHHAARLEVVLETGGTE
jgi:hypothetical protein